VDLSGAAAKYPRDARRSRVEHAPRAARVGRGVNHGGRVGGGARPVRTRRLDDRQTDR
jgi:hypothetical protein